MVVQSRKIVLSDSFHLSGFWQNFRIALQWYMEQLINFLGWSGSPCWLSKSGIWPVSELALAKKIYALWVLLLFPVFSSSLYSAMNMSQIIIPLLEVTWRGHIIYCYPTVHWWHPTIHCQARWLTTIRRTWQMTELRFQKRKTPAGGFSYQHLFTWYS